MKDCKCNSRGEYGSAVSACVRNVAPSCKNKAVIPNITIETPAGLRNLSDCFAHVLENNTTYYIDDKGRTTITWAGPVEVDAYDYQTNPRHLRSQSVYDFLNNIEIYYNATGQYRIKTLSVGV